MKDESGPENFAVSYSPSLWVRIWRKLGYQPVICDLPPDIHATHPGWMMTEMSMRFSFGDRVRLLVSGRLNLMLRQATTQEVDGAVSALSHRILYPGEK